MFSNCLLRSIPWIGIFVSKSLHVCCFETNNSPDFWKGCTNVCLLTVFPLTWGTCLFLSSPWGKNLFLIHFYDSLRTLPTSREKNEVSNECLFFKVKKIFQINFCWCIVALQCCITFCCTAKWISYMHLNECLKYGFERKAIVFQYKGQKIKGRESLFVSPFQYQTNSITNLKVCKRSSWAGSLHSEGGTVRNPGSEQRWTWTSSADVAIGLWFFLCLNPLFFQCFIAGTL